MRRPPTRRMMLVDKLLQPLNALLVHQLQRLLAQFDIGDQRVTPALGEILPDHHAEHLEILRVRRHVVRRHDPAPSTQTVRQSKLVIRPALLRGKSEGDERETLAGGLGHEDEALGFDGCREVVGCAGEIGHDGAVAVLAETDELVVLADDLAGALGEVEREGGLVRAEVVDVEDEFLGEVLGAAPDDPAYAGVDEAVLRGGG